MRQVFLHQDEDGVWIATVPSLPGVNSDGDSRDEALENVKDAIQVWLEVARERGWPIPDDPGTADVAAVSSLADEAA